MKGEHRERDRHRAEREEHERPAPPERGRRRVAHRADEQRHEDGERALGGEDRADQSVSSS